MQLHLTKFMLSREFFQIPKDNVARNELEMLFAKNDLHITRTPDYSELGQYPVLYVDLKVNESIHRLLCDADRERKDVTGGTMKAMLDGFKTQMADLTGELIDSGLLPEPDSNRLSNRHQTYLKDIMKFALPDEEWPAVGLKLTRMLHTVNNKKVIILIDEYDTPMSSALQNSYLEGVCSPQIKQGTDFTLYFTGQRLLPPFFLNATQGLCIYVLRAE
jgi:hypothetical protein